MRLIYKQDWNNITKAFEAWWNNELNRPLVQIISPKNVSYEEWIKNSTFESGYDEWAFIRYMPNIKKALKVIMDSFSKTFFGNEAYPNVFINLGPGITSAYLGAELRFDGRTVWFSGMKSLDDLENVKFNPKNNWWQYSIKCIKMALNECYGKAIVAFPDLLDPITVTGLLMGNYPVNIIKSMYKDQERLKKVLDKIHDILLQCYEEMEKIIKVSENGYSTWMRLWSNKKYFPVQCDTIVFMSPKLFDELLLPHLFRDCEYFKRTIWHLDGPEELIHLDKLLNIPELNGIQWVPGAKNPDTGDDRWIPLYKKIQEKDKLLVLPGVPAEKVMHLLTQIKPKGILLQVTCKSLSIAEKLIKELQKKGYS
jgi:5-methyltetrahydrofolate--homocysteine methyltransferase